MSKIFEKLVKEASWDSSKNKYLFFLYLIFLLVQTVNFLLFVEIRFSMGLPDDHWGIFFVKEFPTGFWYFLRNGWIFYALFSVFYWLKIRSIIICLIGFLPIFVIVAIFDFCFVFKDSVMYFRFDLIGLVISIFVIFVLHFIGIICSVLKKYFSRIRN